MNEIPIRNIYYMVLYAWDKVKDISQIAEKNIEGLRGLNDVIIELFLNEVSQILKRGIGREYINLDDQAKFIKGKIDIARSIKLIQPNLICYFDEYCDDILLNQIIKAILIRIIGIQGVKVEHKKRARSLLLQFTNVKLISLNDMILNNISFNKLNKAYEYVIDMGLLIYKNAIPTEEDGNYRFADIMKDEEQISSIFEEFLRNFYKIHSNYSVNRRYYNFDWEPIDNSNIGLLPRMETDIELTLDNTKVIIDAKYYRNAFSSKSETKKLISNNIYQMKAYLNQNIGKFDILRGILIYPSNGYEITETFYSKIGYSMEFRTIDLNREWKDIESRLMGMLQLLK